MKKLFLFFLIFYSIVLNAQQVQWANEVIKFSTEYSRNAYGAKMILGSPNKLPAWGESPMAWAPATMDNPRGEFIEVGFEIPQQISQVAIGESNCPGAIKKVIAIDTKNKKYILYQNDTILPRFGSGGGMKNIVFPRTEYSVKAIRVELNTKAISGMNQLDCIGISESREFINAVIDTIPYSYNSPAENLGPLINSRVDDMLPIISPDGNTLYFARKKHNENIGDEKRDDIWVSTLDENNNWTAAKNIGAPLNNEYHNYVAWVSADGKTLTLANDYKNPGVGQRVSISTEKENVWTFPTTLKINDMYNKNEFSCYHLNAEGNVLFLAIQRGDTYGDMDIYISFLQKNKVWTVPKNLGAIINTAATEGSVFIAADNKTLYFASNGRSGFGGFDMYMSKRLDDTWMNWSEPKNLGQQINSKYDDFYYTIPASGEYAYFSSRQNSIGGADLFKIALPKEIQPEPVALITGKIIDKESGKTMEATMEYGGLINIEPTQKFTNADGKYAMIIPDSSYSITIRKEGYFPILTNPDLQNSTMNLDYNATDPVEIIKHTLKQEVNSKLKNYSGDSIEISELIKESYRELENQTTIQDTLLQEITDELTEEYNAQNNFREKKEDIEMIPIREGQVLTLNNVFFDANRSTLKENSKYQLLEIAVFLKSHPNIYVEIGGHTNGLPEDDFCMQLSDARAKNVAEFIIQQGVESSRVTYKGYGKSFPIADNATLEGRKKNQRVELKIIKITR